MSVGEATETPRLEALAALTESGAALATGTPVAEALEGIALAVATATASDLAVIRVAQNGALVVRAVGAESTALAAELRGARVPAEEAPERIYDELDSLPAAFRSTAERLGATEVLVMPLVPGAEIGGSLELYRRTPPFGPWDRVAAGLAVSQVSAALLLGATNGAGVEDGRLLDLAGDALAAGTDEERAADRVARLAARITGATSAWIWQLDGGLLELVAHFGDEVPGSAAGEQAREIMRSASPVSLLRDSAGCTASVQLGQPPLGAVQLRFAPGGEPNEESLGRLASFGVRAAHALRATAETRDRGIELERSRALLEVVSQAIAELSLTHTLETAVARVVEVLDTGRVAVYLQGEERLEAAAVRGLDGQHEVVAENLLEVALGPARGRGLLVVDDLLEDARLADVRAEASAAGIEAALALPLAVGGETIGLLAAFPQRGRLPGENESALLVALAAQLAVVVQNARLHERAMTLGAELEQALEAERATARRVDALYKISRSFAQSLSLEATLDTVAEAVAEALDVGAAVIQLPSARGAELETRALHVTEESLAEAARTIFSRPQPLASLPLSRLLRTGEPLVLDPESALALGGAHALLAPFLRRDATAAIVPIATPAEVLGTLSLVSFEAGRPVDAERISDALSIAGQAALAIDNARLYQQQKAFADTMQRSLLPRSAPHLPGLELGDVYESAATVDVGGDVYDYLSLPGGRLAVVLGDVTGHGVDATADMAMAKFVFRSLAREHSEPADFLAAANEVVVDEIAPGKFITMVELVADPERSMLSCASAGHPPPRLVHPDGTVEALAVSGLALGIEADQRYEQVNVAFPPGSSVTALTDGVIEARRGTELFGLDRLDEVLSTRCGDPPAEIARAVLEACQGWSDTALKDDCAIVVIKRTA